MRALVPRLFSDVGDWFDAEFPQLGTHPIRVEDYQEDGRYVLRAELPGLDPDSDVKVTVDAGVLTVQAQRTEETKDRYHSEFHYGALRRSVTLPSAAEEDKISAKYEHGILEVVVPLRGPAPQGRAIPVEHAD